MSGDGASHNRRGPCGVVLCRTRQTSSSESRSARSASSTRGSSRCWTRFADRFGINVLLVGTISWLGLKVGRRISWKLEGWPDHGEPEEYPLHGRILHRHHPEYYRNTRIRDFQSQRPGASRQRYPGDAHPRSARKRGMKIYPEVMEPLFKYAGHGSANNVQIPNMPQVLEVDVFNRVGQEPCINNPDYRDWWHSIIEDYCRSYDIDGVMWCNERRSPLDNALAGIRPTASASTAAEKPSSAVSTSSGSGWPSRSSTILSSRPARASSSSTAPWSSSCACSTTTPKCWSGSATGSSATRTWTASCTASSSGATRISSSV